MTGEQLTSPAAHIAVIGGGLTGLAAAHRLSELSRERNLPMSIAVYEAGPKLGGLVGTVERDGYLIDVGADSFITNKPGAIELCRRLGLEDRLQATEPRYRGALVLRDGRPLPVPEGFQLLSPTALGPVLASPILTPWGKLRLASEVFVPPRMDGADESLADFVRRRFGAEVLDRLVQPLVGGIYTSDPERLSLAATLPRFIEMERQYGSLIRAARSAKPQAMDEDRTSSGARYGLFAGLRGGMRELVEALVARVSQTCEIVTRRRESSPLSTSPMHATQRPIPLAASRFARGHCRRNVIITLPTYRAASIGRVHRSFALATALNAIDYASSAIVVSGHQLADIADPLHAFGFVVPHIERRRILAVSFSSRKFPNRAPEGRVLLRTFVGGAMQPEYYELDDAALRRVVLEELRDTLGVTGTPDFVEVYRYPRAMPQYHVGHLERVAEIERLAASHRGLALAGNAYRGVGIPDAIHSGERAAERIVDEITIDACE